jgi:plasmid stabilization system protein ParE
VRASYTPECSRDIAEAAEWYRRRDPRLAAEFLDAIEASVAILLDFPRSHELARKHTRRAFLARFPYTLYYVDLEQEVVLLACLHQARHPRRWQGRVREVPDAKAQSGV